MHGCYYNALDYVIRRPGAKLLWGFTLPDRILTRLHDAVTKPTKGFMRGDVNLGELTLHAFAMEGGRLVDPTLGTGSDDWYFWEEVPEAVWRGFAHKANDKDYDARDFADEYITSRLSRHSMTWEALMRY